MTAYYQIVTKNVEMCRMFLYLFCHIWSLDLRTLFILKKNYSLCQDILLNSFNAIYHLYQFLCFR